MGRNTYFVATGHQITVAPLDAPVQARRVDDSTVGAVVRYSHTFGPYLGDCEFVVDGPATVTVSASALSMCTAAQVLAAINAEPKAAELVTPTIYAADGGGVDDGSGIVTAMSRTDLADGAGTGIGTALAGSLYIDTTNAFVYRNSGTQAAPAWTKLGDAA